MTFTNSMDRDQAPPFVGPDLRDILFDTRHQFWLKAGCIHVGLDELNSKDI